MKVPTVALTEQGPPARVGAWSPLVKPIDIFAGTYRVQAESNPDRWYETNVKDLTCSCKAGESGFTSCKHVPYCKHLTAARIRAQTLALLFNQPVLLPAHDTTRPKPGRTIPAVEAEKQKGVSV